MENPATPVAMCVAGLALLLVGGGAARKEFADARGVDKVVALTHLCFAIPLAVFGALHLFGGTQFILDIVPSYMPWRMFWVYFVGCALIAASLSIATKIGVRWSGLLFGVMMFLFVGMIHLPGALVRPGRIIWTIVFREMSFGGAGWILAGHAMAGSPGRSSRALVNVGSVFVAMAALFFGVEHFLHATGLPGVPLARQMPAWLRGREIVDYATGAGLIAAGGSALLKWKTRAVATWVGGWILLLVVVIYGPVMIAALTESATTDRVVGINYFADTLLFAGAILALATPAPPAVAEAVASS